jgi:hypothetical protein
MLMSKTESRAAIRWCRDWGEGTAYVYQGHNGLWGGALYVHLEWGGMYVFPEHDESFGKLLSRIKRRYNPCKIQVTSAGRKETHLRILGKWKVIRSDTSDSIDRQHQAPTPP